MTDKVCTSCGAKLPAGAAFCTQCGGRDLVEAAPAPSMPAPPSIQPDSPTIPLPPTGPPAVAPGAFGSPVAPGSTTTGSTTIADPTAVWGTPPPTAAPAPPVGAPFGAAAPQYPAGTASAEGSGVPGAWAPEPAPEPKGGGKLGALLVLLGGAAAIVGAFLEWMKITPDWADAVTLSGWTLSDDAKIVAGLGGFAVIAGVVVVAGSLRRVLRPLVAAVGIVILGIGAYDTFDILKRLPDSLEEAGLQGVQIAAPGIGLILVMAGGAMVVLGALAMIGGAKAKSPAMTAPGPATTAPSGAPGAYGGHFAPAQPAPAAPPPPFQ